MRGAEATYVVMFGLIVMYTGAAGRIDRRKGEAQ
jgi:hypothetical protein